MKRLGSVLNIRISRMALNFALYSMLALMFFILGCMCGCELENGVWRGRCIDNGFKFMLIDVRKEDSDG
jgi:hypothetical protein